MARRRRGACSSTGASRRRQFQRRFVLAEGIEVQKAHTENGLLHIDLVRPEPEVSTRTIEIDAGP